MNIAVLALQGAFAEHEKMLEKLQAETLEIRKLSDFLENRSAVDGLILPGGESTVMGKLLRDSGLFHPIQEAIQGGLPVFGTCAGLILLAEKIEGQEAPHLATMEIEAKRNAYGRQLGSFYTEGTFASVGQVPMSFIRGPIIASAGNQVEILARVKGEIAAARQKNQLVTAFHPELSDDTRIHKYFLNMCRS